MLSVKKSACASVFMWRCLFPGLALFSLLGCSKTVIEEIPEPGRELHEVVISASTDGNGTKTSVDDLGKVSWSPSDRLGVFFYKELYQFTSINTEPARSADFVGNVAIVGGSNEDADPSRDGYSYWAVYPYNSDATCDGSTITTTLASKQEAKAGSFSDNTFLAVSRSTDYTQFNFHNVSGGVCFTLSADDIQTVKFRGNNGEVLAGNVTVAYGEDGLPVVTSVENGATEIVLNAPYGETFQPGVKYYITALPAKLTEGFTMTFCRENSSMVAEKVMTNAVEIKRNIFGTLNRPDNGLEYFDCGVYNTTYPHPANNQVYYKTSNNRPIILPWHAQSGNKLVSNKYDSEIGYCVLTFKDEIISFSSGDSEDLTGKLYLTEVILPDELLEIGSETFTECLNLTAVVFPQKLRKIGRGAFWSCGLQSIDLPASLDHVGGLAFYEDSQITGTINVHNASVMDHAFAGTGVVNFIAGEGCQYITGTALEGCECLESVVFNNPEMVVGDDFFSNCRARSYSGAFFDAIDRYLIADGSLMFMKPGIEHVDLTDMGVVACSGGVFARQTSLKSLVLPDLCEIRCNDPYSANLFSGSENLESIYAPNLEVYDWFENCASLKSLTVRSVGYAPSLRTCSSINKIVAESIYVGSESFKTNTLDMSGCGNIELNGVRGIKNLILPSMSVASWAFGDSDIKTLKIMGDATLSENSIMNCYDLESITIEHGDLRIEGNPMGWDSMSMPQLVFNEGFGISYLEEYSLGNITMDTLHLEKCDELKRGNIPHGLGNLYLKPGSVIYGMIPAEEPLNVYVNGNDPVVFYSDECDWEDHTQDDMEPVTYFYDDFSWTEELANAYGAGQTIETSDVNASAPNVYTYDESLTNSFFDSFWARGYSDPNPDEHLIYLQNGYLKFSRTSGHNTALQLQVASLPEEPVDVKISFDFAMMIQGTGKVDSGPLVVCIVDGPGYFESSQSNVSRTYSSSQSSGQFLWNSASGIVAKGVSRDTKFLIINNRVWNNGNYYWNYSTACRFFIDNIKIESYIGTPKFVQLSNETGWGSTAGNVRFYIPSPAISRYKAHQNYFRFGWYNVEFYDIETSERIF